jgi:hypothetical protein
VTVEPSGSETPYLLAAHSLFFLNSLLLGDGLPVNFLEFRSGTIDPSDFEIPYSLKRDNESTKEEGNGIDWQLGER